MPDSVADPLGYYLANTGQDPRPDRGRHPRGRAPRDLSSTAAVYGEPEVVPVPEDLPLNPINPYGRSKLMSEWMIADAAAAHGFTYVVLRYFNVAGADPAGRSGQSTPDATHLIKVATQAALGRRARLDVYGTDTRRRTARACATTSRSRTWRRRTGWRSTTCAGAARA